MEKKFNMKKVNKVKRYFMPLFIAITLTAMLASCGNNETPETAEDLPVMAVQAVEEIDTGTAGADLVAEEEAAPENDIQPEPDGYYFIYNGINIVLNDNIEQIISKIGDANNIFEAPSCAFEGIDKIFYYDNFYINTYPDGDKDLILSITLTDESAQTPERLGIGMKLEDMINAYGNNYDNNFDLYTYIKGDAELAFFFDGDILVDIAYYFLPAINQ
jgi:hypothetical protein